MNVSKALVVDDSKVARVVLKRMLEARGLGVDTAASGQEALDYLIGHVPDVIFMDFMMHGMDGYEATAIIRANSRTSAIPVIMCTGNDTLQERARAHECGASDFVIKPVSEAALDALLAQLQKHVVAPMPLAGPAPIAATDVAVPIPAEDTVRIAERIAHDVAERLVREAIAALSATYEQTSRSIAQAVATSATQDALASWREEVAKTNDGAEQMAIAAAERVARTILGQAADDIEAARRSTETVIDEKLVEALAAVSSTAERVARETLDAATAAIRDQSREASELAHADLQASVRIAAEAAAKPVAETAARAVAEEMARNSLVTAREDEAALRSQLEQTAIAAAERVAQSVVQQAIDKEEAERASTGAVADETLREAMLTVQSTAERVARETLDSAKAAIEDTSRQALESARADLQESVRIAAEVAAKPVAEVAARVTIEHFARETLAAVVEEEAASRRRFEQTAIAVAERVGRELVELAFSAAASKRQAAAGETDHATESIQAIGEQPFDQLGDVARAEPTESALQSRESSGAERAETAVTSTPTRVSRWFVSPTAWTAPAALLPWLAALTLAVLYLLVRSFL